MKRQPAKEGAGGLMKGLKIGRRVFSFSKTRPEFSSDHLPRSNRQIRAGDANATPENGKNVLPGRAGEKEVLDGYGSKRAAHLRAAAGEKLLESFKTRKKAEREEDWKQSESSQGAEDEENELREVFLLTRNELVRTLGPLNERSLGDDSLLEKALEKIHKRLPLPIRLIFWKKRYIQFILDNRERLIP
jgi:hypothetical protein